MDLEMRVMDQFVNEEGSDQERACWRKIRSAMREANSNTVLADVLSEIEKLEDWKDVKDLKFIAKEIKKKHFS